MIELKGKNGTTKVFTNNVEQEAISQIIKILNNPISENTTIRIMPDVHAGKGCTIGTTILLPKNKKEWKICPNVIGVDIFCGVIAVKINNKITQQDLAKLDTVINLFVPSGFNVHNSQTKDIESKVQNLINNVSFKLKDEGRIINSMASLGGGNHFIEMGVDSNGSHWILIHSGSRNFGKQIAEHHQKIAEQQFKGISRDVHEKMIAKLKSEGRQSEIKSEITKLKNSLPKTDKGLEYLTGELASNYISDMMIAQEYGKLNREEMINIIVEKMGWNIVDSFDSAHNFIDRITINKHYEENRYIIRKGATGATLNERLIIPLNMRDGSLICIGKGNEDWNYSAPHGAGRLMSRSQAKRELNMQDFKDAMEGIYTTSVVNSTLDEAPDAYKNAQEIIDNIKDTVEIIEHLKPVYNYKSH